MISETGDVGAIYHGGATLDNDPEPLSERARIELGQHAAKIIDLRVGRREVVHDWREDSHPLLDAEEEWTVDTCSNTSRIERRRMTPLRRSLPTAWFDPLATNPPRQCPFPELDPNTVRGIRYSPEKRSVRQP